MRFKITEISFLRIFKAVGRRLSSLPNKLSWSFSKESNLNRRKISKFKNKYAGERCFLVANGPSLKKMNLSFLKNEISFGLNRIYLAYDEMGFKNDFIVSINSIVLSQFHKDFENLEIVKFLNWGSRKYFNKRSEYNLFIFKKLFGSSFGKDISRSLNPKATVTYAALQIIYYMGFKEVIIIGMDHNFKTKELNKPNKLEIRSEEIDVNHFHPNYFPKGSKWETPDLVSSEYFYKLARNMFEKDNRKIYDCTLDGKCEIFEKSNLESFF